MLAASLLPATSASAEPAFSRSFNGPETTWQLLDSNTPARLLAHQCIAGGARDTRGIERISVAAAAGQSVHLACLTPAFAAVDELQIRVWVKSNRPDIQLAARVVLPRSRDPQRNTTATAIVKGPAYNRPGHWQELVLTDFPKLLAAQVRVLRAVPGASIDAHEAYVDSVVLVVPGDPNGVELGTDQLEVEGVELKQLPQAAPSQPSASPNVAAASPTSPSGAPLAAAAPRTSQASPARPGSSKSPVRLQGSILLVDDKPFLPRVIQWNGESLQFLAERGFNVVELPAPPTPEQSADAARHDLWLLCVPPRPETILRDGIGAASDRVLAWYLQDDAIEADPNYATRWADTVRERDVVYGRPIIFAPNTTWEPAYRSADIAIARNPRAARMSDVEFQRWFDGRPAYVRPGTPLWVGLHTQFGDAVRTQTNTLTRTEDPAPVVDPDQLRSLIHVACTSGVQGFEFQSTSPLSASDPASQRRAAAVELINRRLQLMEPWLASGKVIGRITSTGGEATAEVLYFDRARLLIPLAEKEKQRAAAASKPPAQRPKEIALLVPGVPESSQVYYLTSASMRSLASNRVAGGTRLSFPSSGEGLVVITEDPQAVQGLRQRVTRHASQTARLQRNLLVEQAQSILDTDRRIGQLGAKPTISAADNASINARLAQLDSFIAGNELEQAQDLAADITADFHRKIAFQQLVTGVSSGLQSNALGLTSNRIADFVKLQQSFENLTDGQNLLTGGDFESLNEMTQFGWQHVVHPQAGGQTHAELSATQPQHGAYSLELQASSPAKRVTTTDDALVWIVSPNMPVTKNATVEITGWIRVDQPFAEPGQGLVILDSLGGPELSLLVGQTSGWETFRMIRAVPQTGDLRLTFALNGPGSAKIDAVMARTLEQPVARRLPQVPAVAEPTPPPTPSDSMAEAPGPISRLPPPR